MLAVIAIVITALPLLLVLISSWLHKMTSKNKIARWKGCVTGTLWKKKYKEKTL